MRPKDSKLEADRNEPCMGKQKWEANESMQGTQSLERKAASAMDLQYVGVPAVRRRPSTE